MAVCFRSYDSGQSAQPMPLFSVSKNNQSFSRICCAHEYLWVVNSCHGNRREGGATLGEQVWCVSLRWQKDSRCSMTADGCGLLWLLMQKSIKEEPCRSREHDRQLDHGKPTLAVFWMVGCCPPPDNAYHFGVIAHSLVWSGIYRYLRRTDFDP